MKTANLLPASFVTSTFLLAACSVPLVAATSPGDPGSAHAAIPYSGIGAKATADYQGDALAVTATADGTRLRCDFQRLEGHATREGLWLESTEQGGGGLHLVATVVGREGGADDCAAPLWASFVLGNQGALACTGTVEPTDKLVRFVRPGLTEEYSVSVDGVRQDFVIASRPAGGGDLRVELALRGARAEAAAYGAKLTPEGSGRALAYSRLRAEDARGKELTARLEVLSTDRLAVRVDDADAAYPVRIDPTFSDADWVNTLSPSMPGANGPVTAIAVDGSGNVYLGGDFTAIGTVLVNHIAKWDGISWSALGSGMNGGVNALAVSGTDLYAGGRFTSAGGVAATNIAKWDGSAWSTLGSGMNSSVYALALSGTDLYAGGYFATAGGVPANCIAKWNGSTWSALGSGMDGWVYALAVSGTDLYAGGRFTSAGGVAATNIAKWDGSTWSALGSGMDNDVCALAVNGTNLYAGGFFTTAGTMTVNSIAKWDGSAWSALGSGMNNGVKALAMSGTNLYAGGFFTTAGTMTVNSIAKWDGSAWSALGLGCSGEVNALAVSGTNLYAGGLFVSAGGVAAKNIAKWDGSAWFPLALGLGCSGMVNALAVSGTNLYAGGLFVSAGGVAANRIAKWDGSAWSALGSGMDGWVSALAVSGTNLYAGGWFTKAGGVTVNNIAKWNGSAWSALGSGTRGGVWALAVSGTNLYVGGQFFKAGEALANNIAKWDGSTWSALGPGLDDVSGYPNVNALAVSGTDLYAGGRFTSAGGVAATNIAKWDGSTWSALVGLGIGGFSAPHVNALVVSGTDLYAGGWFTTAGGVAANCIAKWDGNTWSALGLGTGSSHGPDVNALAVSGTDLYAGGYFATAGGVTANYIAKWNGSAWSALGSGVNDVVNALTADGAGHLFVGGNFSVAGTNVSPFIAQANIPRLTQARDACDDFNDNATDPAIWGDDLHSAPGCRLAEENGRLEFTSTTTDSITAVRPCVGVYGNYTLDLSVQSDLNVGSLVPPINDTEDNPFLVVWNRGDMVGGWSGDHCAIALNVRREGTGALVRRVEPFFRVDNVQVGSSVDYAQPTASQNVAVRITYEATTHTLSAWWDADGAANGYAWSLLRAERVDAAGSDWQMTPGTQFQFGIGGHSEGLAITAANAFYADNFCATVQTEAGPVFGPDSDVITNLWLGLFQVGDSYSLAGVGTFTGVTRTWSLIGCETVLGVKCVVLRVLGHGTGFDATRYYDSRIAQDIKGNLYILAMAGTEPDGTQVAWAASSPSQAAMGFPAQPEAGQSWALPDGQRLDVLGLNQTVPQLTTGLGPYTNCIQFRNLNDGGADVDDSWRAPGLGVVKEIWNDGGQSNGWERATASVPFGAWALSIGLPANGRAPADRNGPLDLPNLLAYALAVNPFTAEPLHLPSGSLQAIGGQTQFLFTYRLSKTATGIQVEVVGAGSLFGEPWLPVNATPAHIGQAPDGLADIWQVSIPVESSNRFFRLRVRQAGQQAELGMVLIPAGSFTMGDTLNEGNAAERPTHTVYVSGFYMDTTEVPKALWDTTKTWAGGNGYSFDNTGAAKGTNHPVHSMNWHDAVKWCNARSQMDSLTPCYYIDAGLTVPYKTGQTTPSVDWNANGYRLPTEAEWEKAARGSISGNRFPWGSTIMHSQANYKSTGGFAYDISPTLGYHPAYKNGTLPYTNPVGAFAPTGYGLYDMVGNLYEWCWDGYYAAWYSNAGATQMDTSGPVGPLSNRVARGGSWADSAFEARSAQRTYGGQAATYTNVGFRCVRRP